VILQGHQSGQHCGRDTQVPSTTVYTTSVWCLLCWSSFSQRLAGNTRRVTPCGCTPCGWCPSGNRQGVVEAPRRVYDSGKTRNCIPVSVQPSLRVWDSGTVVKMPSTAMRRMLMACRQPVSDGGQIAAQWLPQNVEYRIVVRFPAVLLVMSRLGRGEWTRCVAATPELPRCVPY
jgi:hypothetical protein